MRSFRGYGCALRILLVKGTVRACVSNFKLEAIPIILFVIYIYRYTTPTYYYMLITDPYGVTNTFELLWNRRKDAFYYRYY